ncbi:MAG: cytochrome c, partial [Bdellovibrionota bacterium]
SLGGFREPERADEDAKKPEEIEVPHQQSETATRRLAEQAVQARIHSVYQSQCADCHGATGRGDDSALAKVSGAPQDFSDPEYWAKIDRDDEMDRLEQAILDGKWKTGGPRRMPPFRGQLSDEEVKLMIGYLRGMAGVKEADKKP